MARDLKMEIIITTVDITIFIITTIITAVLLLFDFERQQGGCWRWGNLQEGG